MKMRQWGAVYALSISLSILSGITYATDTTSDHSTAVQAETDTSADALFRKGSDLIRQKKLRDGIQWLKKAAAQNHAEALFELASYHELGVGVNQDYSKARDFYEKAIAQGHRDAQFNLALLMINEQAPFQDLKKARELMEGLAKKDDVDAKYSLSVMYSESLGTIPTDPDNATLWLGAAAYEGHPQAQFNLGLQYLRGDFVTKDDQQAFSWFRKAAEKDMPEAQFNLALMYENGDGTQADITEALYWYESAAQSGNANAQQNLGIKYLLGKQIAQDNEKALNLISKAAGNGLVNSQYLLGRLYHAGREGVVTADMAKAEQWYLKAAKQGHPDAQYYLAVILSEEETRMADAKFWVRQAVLAGHEKAKALQAQL